MKKFFLYLGVYQNFIGQMRQSFKFVDIPLKPVLSYKGVDGIERNHIFALEVAFPPNTLFVGLFVAQFTEILDQRYENVFRVVFLKLWLMYMGVAVVNFSRVEAIRQLAG